MDDSASDDGALFEATAFLRFFNHLLDSRQPGKVVYPLDEVLLLSLLAVLAGAEAFTDIARFGDKKLALLRRFRPFPRRNAATRYAWRHLRHAGRRSVPALLRCLGGLGNRHPGWGHRHRRQDSASLRP